MKEKQLIIKRPKVNMFLNGATQFRLHVKPRDIDVSDGVPYLLPYASGVPEAVKVQCPFGKTGDRIYVRETWRTLQKWDNMAPRNLPDDIDKIDYAAEGYSRNPLWAWGKSRPSIHMPRWASRILLEVVSVRVERLQDISEEDAKAEGVEAICDTCNEDCRPFGCGTCRPRFKHSFADLWETINGPGSWDANPWVWVIDVKRITA